MARETAARFWAKVNKNGPWFVWHDGFRSQRSRCWVWTRATQSGYGAFRVHKKIVRAHVWAWEDKHGPVPTGLELDHLCRTPLCVRTSHLEAVTHQINVLRGSAPSASCALVVVCPVGHPYDSANTYLNPSGSRQCRVCGKEAARAYRARKKCA